MRVRSRLFKISWISVKRMRDGSYRTKVKRVYRKGTNYISVLMQYLNTTDRVYHVKDFSDNCKKFWLQKFGEFFVEPKGY